MLSDCRHPCFRNFDSVVSIDVIRMKSYLDSLFDPTCVSVRVTCHVTCLLIANGLFLEGQGKVREFHFESGDIKVFERSQGKVKSQEYTFILSFDFYCFLTFNIFSYILRT